MTNATEWLWRWWIDNCLPTINNVFLAATESSPASWCHGRRATRKHIYSVCLISMVMALEAICFYLIMFLICYVYFFCAGNIQRSAHKQNVASIILGIPWVRVNKALIFCIRKWWNVTCLSADKQHWLLLWRPFEVLNWQKIIKEMKESTS